jgi:hypothetical protein
MRNPDEEYHEPLGHKGRQEKQIDSFGDAGTEI